MIMLRVSRQSSREVLGHYIIHNVTKFQNCRSDNKYFTGEKPSQKHFDRTVCVICCIFFPAVFCHSQSHQISCLDCSLSYPSLYLLSPSLTHSLTHLKNLPVSHLLCPCRHLKNNTHLVKHTYTLNRCHYIFIKQVWCIIWQYVFPAQGSIRFYSFSPQSHLSSFGFLFHKPGKQNSATLMTYKIQDKYSASLSFHYYLLRLPVHTHTHIPILRKIKVAICNHQTDSPFHL